MVNFIFTGRLPDTSRNLVCEFERLTGLLKGVSGNISLSKLENSVSVPPKNLQKLFKRSTFMLPIYNTVFLDVPTYHFVLKICNLFQVSGRHLTLLVIDDQNTDWSKYFRGRKIGDYDIRVEQAEFKEINVTASSDGANVSMAVYRGGTRVGRSFRPDFLLVS